MRSLAVVDDREELERRLGALQAGDARLWGEMSLAEMLCHVRGAFRTAMGEIEVVAKAPAQPLPPKVLKFVALRMPVPWPKGMQTLAELKKGTPAMRAGAVEEERAGLLEAMKQFVRPEQRRGDHGMFGPMTYGDWMRWGYLHTDHHLRQFGR